LTEPTLRVPSPDGTSTALVRTGRPDGPPVLLVHGAAADHTTWRVLGPMLGARRDVWAMDRRGRGASGDTLAYAIEREFEDVAGAAEVIAAERRTPTVDVVGHSYGGRCALGAARRTAAIGRVVSYEGAPAAPGARYGDARLAVELATLAEAGRLDELLETFLRRVVGMTDEDVARYRADPVWRRRVAAAPTIARELAAEAGDEGALEALGAVRQPVLQVLGGASRPEFATATLALDARLPDGRIAIIPEAKHAAHHTHPVELLAALEDFLTPAV
jgi:pimeloyl-ACP methyl ester carboxylesterase